ncbi:MAG TPA: hypothetical protein VI078_05735 [bacterium]
MWASCGLHGRERILALAAAVLLAGCAAPGRPGAGTPAPAASGGAAPSIEIQLQPTEPPADIGAVERYAWMSVVQLGEAYESGDVDGFLSRVSRGFYRGYPALEGALRQLVAETTSRRVVVAVRGVETEDDRISVRAQWERVEVGRDGVSRARAGETVFLFLRSDTSLRLLDFRGDVPFGIEGIPGLP